MPWDEASRATRVMEGSGGPIPRLPSPLPETTIPGDGKGDRVLRYLTRTTPTPSRNAISVPYPVEYS
jgi:hypothetical protein